MQRAIHRSERGTNEGAMTGNNPPNPGAQLPDSGQLVTGP